MAERSKDNDTSAQQAYKEKRKREQEEEDATEKHTDAQNAYLNALKAHEQEPEDELLIKTLNNERETLKETSNSLQLLLNERKKTT